MSGKVSLDRGGIRVITDEHRKGEARAILDPKTDSVRFLDSKGRPIMKDGKMYEVPVKEFLTSDKYERFGKTAEDRKVFLKGEVEYVSRRSDPSAPIKLERITRTAGFNFHRISPFAEKATEALRAAEHRLETLADDIEDRSLNIIKRNSNVDEARKDLDTKLASFKELGPKEKFTVLRHLLGLRTFAWFNCIYEKKLVMHIKDGLSSTQKQELASLLANKFTHHEKTTLPSIRVILNAFDVLRTFGKEGQEAIKRLNKFMDEHKSYYNFPEDLKSLKGYWIPPK